MLNQPDARGVMFFGNSSGLLAYDGVSCFSTPAYFSDAYLETYGVRPSQVRK